MLCCHLVWSSTYIVMIGKFEIFWSKCGLKSFAKNYNDMCYLLKHNTGRPEGQGREEGNLLKRVRFIIEIKFMNRGFHLLIKRFLVWSQLVYSYVDFQRNSHDGLIFWYTNLENLQNAETINKQHFRFSNVLCIRALNSIRKHLCKHSCVKAISMRTSILLKWIFKERIEEFLFKGRGGTLECQYISWVYLSKYRIL